MQPSSDEPDAQTGPILAVSVHDGRRVLRVTLNGQALDIGANRLRMHCRCAPCTRARLDGSFAPAGQNIEIEHVTPIGQYGLNVAFSDGHSRGIFPFVFLTELAAFQAAADQTSAGIAKAG